jgi:CheY-like chemotaxis protein
LRNLYAKFLIIFILNTTLNASYLGDTLKNLDSNNLYALIVAILLFLYIVYKFIFRKKSNKKRVNSQKNVDEHLYLQDIVVSALNEYKSINSCEVKDKNAIEKDIINKLTEANIYLNTVTNKINTKVENFDLEEFIKEINYTFYDKKTHKEFNIITNSNISYSIITDKSLLKDIFTLLALLQFKEHNLKNATANIELNRKSKLLRIMVKQGLDYNVNIQKALNNNLNPIYNSEKKRYYGIYLYLINKLVNSLGGVVKIDILKNIYTLDISIPINIEHLENRANLLLPKEFKNDKKALIICEDDNLSSSIESFLSVYHISCDIITDNKIVQMPNFSDYDILITNSALLISMISDYLISIKSNHNLKIVSIESKDKRYNYQNGLVDFRLDKPILQSKVYKMILHIFHDEIIKTSEPKEIKNNSIIDAKNLKNSKIVKHNRVLVADDDRVNLHLLVKMIEQFNVDVVTAKDGQEALDILEKDKNFDLIILDSIMPRLSAHEAIKKIRAKEEYNSIPVIIHSSFSMKEHSIDTIFKLGFDSYLPKPFNMEKLQSILQRYLQIDKLAIKNEKIDRTKYYEEFLAIYGNSDKLVEKFASENQKSQLQSLLRDLKNISIKIDNQELAKSVVIMQDRLKSSDDINSDLIYNLVNKIKESKSRILSKID